MAGTSGRVQKTSSDGLGLSAFIVIPLGKRCGGRCPCCSARRRSSSGGQGKAAPRSVGSCRSRSCSGSGERAPTLQRGKAPHIA
eukprot:10374829-Heterocapsa_arctica.AAC.1